MEKWQKQIINGMYGIKSGEITVVSYGGRGSGKSQIIQQYNEMFAKQQELMNQCKEKGYTMVTIDASQMTSKNRKEMIDWCTQNCKKDFASFVAARGIFMFEDETDSLWFKLAHIC